MSKVTAFAELARGTAILPPRRSLGDICGRLRTVTDTQAASQPDPQSKTRTLRYAFRKKVDAIHIHQSWVASVLDSPFTHDPSRSWRFEKCSKPGVIRSYWLLERDSPFMDCHFSTILVSIIPELIINHHHVYTYIYISSYIPRFSWLFFYNMVTIINPPGLAATAHFDIGPMAKIRWTWQWLGGLWTLRYGTPAIPSGYQGTHAGIVPRKIHRFVVSNNLKTRILCW